MNEKEIRDKVAHILVDHLSGVDLPSIGDNQRLCDDLGADDLDLVEIMLHLEEDFDIVISDDEFPEEVKVVDIIELVQRKHAESGPHTVPVTAALNLNSTGAAVPQVVEGKRPSEWAIQTAARCWCDPRTSDRVMDPVLAAVFAEKLDQVRESCQS